MAEVAQARKGHALKSLSSDENLNPKIRDFVAILICVAYFNAFIELSIQEYQKQCSPCIYKYPHNFFVAILVMPAKTTVFVAN